ncbi:MAG: ChbG/HpnK family deacetylase [Acidobacteriota bacterium]
MNSKQSNFEPRLVFWRVVRLIVNADDFGMTAGINRAVLELHQVGALTSATLMARAAATSSATEMARANPRLGVGCHVVLVDGEPISAGRTSLAPGGHFYPTLGGFLRALFRGAIREADLYREAFAQIQSLQASGVTLTHIDTHKHTHMFPQVLRPVLRAAKECGIRAVRNPFEPQWSIAATPGAPWVRRLEVRLLRRLEPRFRRIVAEEGFATTDGAIGVLATGTLDAATIDSLLRAAPASGTYELVTHPGYNDAELGGVRTRLRESRNTEREALLRLRAHPQVGLISFAALA